MAGAGLWADCVSRGPPCAPTPSGRPPVQRSVPAAHAAAHSRSRRPCRQHAVHGAYAVRLASQAVATEQQQQRLPAFRVQEVQEIDDLQIEPAPGPGQAGKPLKINMDLRLYRARLERLQAHLTPDFEQRKRLLRSSEAQLRRCLDMDPADPRTYVVLGKLLVQQKRYDEARRLYAEGTSNTGNNNPYIWAAWGYLEASTGNVARARKLLDAAVAVDETHAAAWHKWGMLEMRQGNYLRARDLWTRGIQRCKRHTSTSTTYLYCSLAVMAGELGRLSEARAWFEDGTRMHEGRASCALWHAWAMLESRIGDASAVRYLYKRALQANPRSRYTHLAWALWERQQRNDSACLQLLQRGLAFNPQDPALYQVLGLVEAEGGNLQGARAYFEAGLRVDPRHVHLWQAMAVMEAKAGDLERARQLFQEGVWADPGNKDAVVVFQAWGVLEMRAGNHSLARELFKAALKVDPKNEATWGTWIAMEDDLGRAEAANELRIRRSEQQWEFVIPASFSTRPEGNTLLASLLNTLNTFFGQRGRQAAGGGGGGAGGGGGGGSLGDTLLAQLLPPDFRDDVKLEDMMVASATTQVQYLQQQQLAALARQGTPAAAPRTSSSSGGGGGSSSSSGRGPLGGAQPPAAGRRPAGVGGSSRSAGSGRPGVLRPPRRPSLYGGAAGAGVRDQQLRAEPAAPPAAAAPSHPPRPPRAAAAAAAESEAAAAAAAAAALLAAAGGRGSSAPRHEQQQQQQQQQQEDPAHDPARSTER